jgi:catechol 2,3-dioxygenase-like lactoylglutathione lyase family enzyme
LEALLKIICLALILAFRATTLSQAVNPPTESPAALGAFFALVVPNIDASAQWYREKLGLKTAMSITRQGRFAFTTLEGDNLIVELIQDAQAVGKKEEPPVHGISKVGVIVADFDKTVEALRARGVEIVAGPFPKRPDMRANVVVKDNAGNLIQFFGK